MTVYLVGAGPGDAGLLTVRGAELLARADAVVHDRLVHGRLLGIAPRRAEIHDVGKQRGEHAHQQDINELLVSLGERWPDGTVVRLKGGDPFIFGRGGEEATALREAGVDYEVVPGVSSVNGATGYAGIPLTHRGLSAGFAVVSGHGADARTPVDWGLLARLDVTLVILMGVEHRAEIAEHLISGGKPPSTPVALIEDGTLPTQRTVRTTLGALGALEAHTPATIVVGDVASLDLSWFETRPLFSWTVAITRDRDQASQLGAALAEAGAATIEVPTIEIVPATDGGAALSDRLSHIGEYTWVVFTSRNAVRAVFDNVHDARALSGTKVASVGKATASELAARGVVADLVPDRFSGEDLAQAFVEPTVPGSKILIPRAAAGGEELVMGLEGKGFVVETVEAYRNLRPRIDPGVKEAASQADAVTFASSSSVNGWVELIGVDRLPPVVATIGPSTSRTARSHGIEVTVEASESTIAGLVAALSGYARRTQGLGADAGTPRRL